jgi:hypothetical protein
MACSSQTIDNLEAAIKKAMTGDGAQIQQPTDLFYRPLYSIQGYKTTVATWTAGWDTAQSKKAEFKLDEGVEKSKTDSSSTTISGEAALRHVPIISLTVNGRSEESQRTVDLAKSSAEVSVAVTYKNSQVFTIDSGDW